MNRTILLALLALIVIAAGTLLRMEHHATVLEGRIATLTEEVHTLSDESRRDDIVSTTYPSTNGPHTVTTPYQTGETTDQWKARHQANVDHDQANGYPLVPPS